MTDDDVTRGPAVADREQALADIFVLLADTLVDDYDVVDLLDQLTRACVDLLGVKAAGLLLDDQKGNLAVVASSSDEIRLLEVFQLQTNEGPCLDCVRTGTSVACADLDAERARWPRFVPAALAAGFGSVAAMPMRLRDQVIGALNVFHARAEPVSAKDQRLAQALADVATIGILQRRSAHRSSAMAEQLQHALNSRVVIEQAKGVLAERFAVDMDTAFESLRRYARDHNLKLTETAYAVTRGAIALDTLSVPPS
ncbi:MAG TPA: GAF and ANTAR domain-containing protein [Mycobacteriales bacterium]|jgi:GAF domain-containing protein|nr:GAF and ANTAR domain-containing protein [Mycobacteriales bacterium]